MRAWRYLISSLTGRIFLAFIAPATLAIVCLSIVDDLSAKEGLKIADDKTLNILSRMISNNLGEKDGKLALNIPPHVLDDIQSNRGDKVFYSIHVQNQAALGSNNISIKSPNMILEYLKPNRISRGVDYFDGYAGIEEVRVARSAKKIEGIDGEVLIYVASVPSSRRGAERWMAGTFTTNGVVFWICLLVIVAFSVRWAIKPLSGLKNEIEARPVDEDKPIPLDNVPVELRSVVTAFNDLIHRLHDLLATTRRFTADASHQMRTPLSILRTHLDVIRREGVDGPKGRSSLEDVQAAASRLERLLTQLLALARAEDAKPGRIAELFEQVDIVAIARNVAGEHVADALNAGIELQFDAGPVPIPVLTVDMLAHEMIANLLDNAIRYNTHGGSVWLSVHESERGAHVVIEDDGPGIPSHETERMYERFTRLSRDRNHEGSGLGLAIVLALAKAIEVAVTLSPRVKGTGVRADILFPHLPNREAFVGRSRATDLVEAQAG